MTWDEQAPAAAASHWAVERPTQGSVRFAREAVSSDGRATYPAVASTDDGMSWPGSSGPAGQTVVQTERLQF